jgi:hypothetical protein
MVADVSSSARELVRFVSSIPATFHSETAGIQAETSCYDHSLDIPEIDS